MLKCGACAWQANGACAKKCKQECRVDKKVVDNCYCPGTPLEKISLCHPSECPPKFGKLLLLSVVMFCKVPLSLVPLSDSKVHVFEF